MNRRRLLMLGAAAAGMAATGMSGCGGGGTGSTGGPSSSSSSSSSSRAVTTYTGQTEFKVGPASINEQQMVAVASLANGDFVVAWVDFTLVSGSTYQSNVRVKIYTATGGVRTSDFFVSAVGAGAQMRPAVCGLTGGDFVVVWEDGTPYVKAQVFSAAGAAKGALISVNTTASRMQWSAAVAGLTGGGFVVAWLEDDANFWTNPAQQHIVRGQIFTAAGGKSGSEFLIASQATIKGFTVQVAALSDGNIVAAWDGIGVQAGIFNTSGQAISPTISFRTANAATPTVAGLTGGGFVVVWSDASGTAITGQVMSNSGVAISALLAIGAGTTIRPAAPSVAALSNGQFVTTWNQNDNDGDGSGIRGQVFNADGRTFNSEFAVNPSLTGIQKNGAVAGLADGGFVAAWNDQPVSTEHFSPKARIFVAE